MLAAHRLLQGWIPFCSILQVSQVSASTIATLKRNSGEIRREDRLKII
jgi:hypothetical protein